MPGFMSRKTPTRLPRNSLLFGTRQNGIRATAANSLHGGMREEDVLRSAAASHESQRIAHLKLRMPRSISIRIVYPSFAVLMCTPSNQGMSM